MFQKKKQVHKPTRQLVLNNKEILFYNSKQGVFSVTLKKLWFIKNSAYQATRCCCKDYSTASTGLFVQRSDVKTQMADNNISPRHLYKNIS